MVLRAAQPSDWDGVSTLLHTVDLPSEDLSSGCLDSFQVLSVGGCLHGVVGVETHGDAGLLRSLAVRHERQGRGYGRLLVEAAETYGVRHDLAELVLLTTTAAGFFAGLGYERIERSAVPPAITQTSEFQTLCPATAVCTQKSLIPAGVDAFLKSSGSASGSHTSEAEQSGVL